MQRDIDTLQSKTFDILVVGGGIYGAALLREAAAQGLSAALVEQADFVSATSANSLKIVHGGLRYLQQADLPRVFESIRERSLLLRTAPHLVAPFPCLMPTTRSLMKSRLVMWAGLLINDILSWNRNAGLVPSRRIPRGRTISRRALLEILPALRDTPATGAATWTDAFAYDSERLPLAMIRAATARGALAANYVRADGFLLDGAQKRVLGVRATDLLAGRPLEIRAAVTIDAASEFSRRLLSTLPLRTTSPDVHLALAVNLILRTPPPAQYGLGLQSAGSHRLYFIAPWRGLTLAGTYYRAHAGAPVPAASIVADADIDAFLDALNRCIPGTTWTRGDIVGIHAGLLPCARPPEPDREPALLHHSRITDHARADGLEGLVSVCSIKYTTARGIAEDVVRLAARKLGRRTKTSPTRTELLPGGDCGDPADYEKTLAAARPDVPPAELARLVRLYGSEARAILDAAPASSPPDALLRAELLRAIREEAPANLGDLLFRRTAWASAGDIPEGRLDLAAAVMAAERGWDDARRRAEADAVRAARTLWYPALAARP